MDSKTVRKSHNASMSSVSTKKKTIVPPSVGKKSARKDNKSVSSSTSKKLAKSSKVKEVVMAPAKPPADMVGGSDRSPEYSETDIENEEKPYSDEYEEPIEDEPIEDEPIEDEIISDKVSPAIKKATTKFTED